MSTAELEVTGRGSCLAINYGSCWPVFLLRQAPAGSLFAWTPTDDDIEFDAERTYPERRLTGRLIDGPRSIAAGRWAVGLGLGQGSDVPEQPDSGAVICVRELDVTDDMAVVRIAAEFGPTCAIEITMEWRRATPEPPYPSMVPIPAWTPPHGGIMDDCHYRTGILRIDPDGRPWYEDVATAERIDIATPIFDRYMVQRRDGEATLVHPNGTSGPSEWDISDVTCVFEAGEVAWVGGPDEAWLPWERALGAGAAGAARYALEVGRGHAGGLPPAAATVTSSTVARLDRETLRQLDAEIRQTGGDRWSEIAPGWYLSNEVGGPGQLLAELNSYGSGGGSNVDDEWLITKGDHGPALGADGWGARRAWRLETPGGHVVWGPDETLTVWEDCSKLVVPPPRTGGVDSLESAIDVEGGIVDAYIFGDAGSDTHVVVDFRDERCRAHPVIGPIIEHLLTDLDSPISPLPTAPPRFALIGRLEASAAGRCVILRDAQGEIWELRLPYDYTFTTEGVLKILDVFGVVHAVERDTIAVNGRPTENGFSVCMVGTPFEVTRIVFVDSASP